MAFTREAVQQLSALHGEPAWLRDRRLTAFDVYERLALPDTKRDHNWRQVDLKGLDLDGFAAFLPPNGRAPVSASGDTAGVIRQRGTGRAIVELDEDLRRQGVVFCSLAEAARDQRELVERHLFSAVTPERDKFSALHGALFTGGTFLYVPDGVVVKAPLVSQFWSGGGASAVLPHSLVVAGAGSQFEYVDEFRGGGETGPLLASGSAEVFLGEGARLGYVGLQRWGLTTWQFANQRFHLGRDASLRMTDVALGGHRARLRLDVMLEGRGSSANVRGLFFATEDQVFDFRTLQDHLAPQTSSDLLFKGALRDRARSVYVGVVRVEKEARGTSANQANRNLLLSEKARASSEPILEIENNDISRCSHGATVGPVDAEHLFYLCSRGIPHRIAQRMLVQGFLAEVLDAIPMAYAREAIEQELSSRID